MTMNGESPIPQLAQVNPIALFLEGLLMEARAGRISSVACVFCPPTGGYATNYVGGQKGDMIIGALSLEKKLLTDIETPQQAPAIIRARMG